jgi:hypothetical protein
MEVVTRLLRALACPQWTLVKWPQGRRLYALGFAALHGQAVAIWLDDL